MNTTRLSLLERVRDTADDSGWHEFDRLYRPLLVHYARRRGMSADEAEEIAQQCFQELATTMSRFRRRVRFRGFLKALVDGKVRRYLAKRQRGRTVELWEDAAACDDSDSPDRAWETQWNRTHLLYCMAELRGEFAPHTLQAFELYVLREVPVAQISRLLGLTPNQIYVAKTRVTRRLKERFLSVLEHLY